MDFSWTVLLVVVVVNAGYMGFMYFLQAIDKSLPPRGSLILGTAQKFLYVQDFNTTTWGDFLAIPLIANAFAHLVVNGFVGPWQWLIFAVTAVADGCGFLVMCLGKEHKPDQGYPEIGKVSWHGLSHLPYHGIGAAMAVLSVWHIAAGNLRGPVFYAALLGGALYVTTFVADIKAGNFDPLKKI